MVSATLAWLTQTQSVCAQQIDETKALKVKAAYLYNFAKFIEWPDDASDDEGSPFVIGVLGDDPFGKILDDTVKAKKIAKRPVKIRRFRWSEKEDRAALKNCQILYISHSEQGRLQEIFAALEGRPVMLAADFVGFASDGGMIGFVLEQERIIFEINREAFDQAQLRASAKLLKLARLVPTMDRRRQALGKTKGKP